MIPHQTKSSPYDMIMARSCDDSRTTGEELDLRESSSSQDLIFLKILKMEVRNCHREKLFAGKSFSHQLSCSPNSMAIFPFSSLRTEK